ncbi:MAG: hypothetical protein ABI237_08680 [Ginsengibacter sp.]
MHQAIVITPVKDSISHTLNTIRAIYENDCKVHHIVYNDFSTPETRKTLEGNIEKYHFELINLEDITSTPSPNYRLVLEDAQLKAIKEKLPLIIVESDVTINKDTFKKMFDFYQTHSKTGLLGAITVDSSGDINFPYLKFKKVKENYVETRRSLSFCCTLLSLEFLRSYSFAGLDSSKDWYDTFISSKAVELGFENYVLMDVPVLHEPHSSRPWKQLKYTNPLKYYFIKFTKGKDKI